MSRKIERTLTVAVPVERAWQAMTEPEELNRWYFPFRMAEDGSAHTEILGHERRSEIVEVEPMRKLRMRTELSDPPFPGIPGTREMTIVWEATASGTRITMTHSGFGEGEDWDRELEATSRGVDETIADLALYLETGVGFPRHNHGERCFHGIAAREVPAGLQVAAVQPDSFAEQAGLHPGDLLVELGGASLFGLAELNFFNKAHAAGERCDAAWVRDGKLERGSGVLGLRDRGSAAA